MGGTTPKQFLEIADRPVLLRAADCFIQFDDAIGLTIVLPEQWVGHWKELCAKHQFTYPHQIVSGGNERYYSVKNGLAQISGEGVVAIHDGARPLVSQACIADAFKAAEQAGAAIPAIPVSESLRKLEEHGSSAVDRTKYLIAQTPQCFQISLIKQAYEQPYNSGFTDDASVAEAAGHAIALTTGHPENIKITNSQDLKIAEALLR